MTDDRRAEIAAASRQARNHPTTTTDAGGGCIICRLRLATDELLAEAERLAGENGRLRAALHRIWLTAPPGSEIQELAFAAVTPAPAVQE